MSFFLTLIDFILHIDVHLASLIAQYGTWIYGMLFGIIFVETGLVIMPLLPGDSLLFVAGSFAGTGHLQIWLLLPLLFVAAVAGDGVNYHIGKYFGHHIIRWKVFGRQLVQQKHIDQTHAFFEKYGPKTIILARFVPIVRTFAPFVAGVGDMSYRTFLTYNIVGAAIWVGGIVGLGYFFGGLPFVKEHFEKAVFLILFLSTLPLIIEFIKHRFIKTKK